MNLFRIISRMHFLSERRRLELFPPFWLMRIKVLELADDWRVIRIKLPLNPMSQNMGNSMFGGYQASLADPIAALACVKNFPGYAIWTRAMQVDFRREGHTDLELRFQFDRQVMQKIQQELTETGRSTPSFEYGFYLKDGSLCTYVVNTVAIRPKGYRAANRH